MAKNKKKNAPGTPSTPGVKNGGVLKAKNAKTPNVNQKKALENAAKETPVKGQEKTNSPNKADKQAKDQRKKEQSVLRAKVKMNEAEDENAKRKFALNLRSLYVRFKTKTYPEDETEIRKIHPKIVDVKFPRTAVKKIKVAEDGDKKEVKVTQYRYCFVEFASEADAEEAKQKLQAMEFMGGTLYVDYMGEKADNRVALAKYQGKQNTKASVNPTRLHVSPLDLSVDDETLKAAFGEHKPLSAVIKWNKKKKKQGGKITKRYGFVQFSGPTEAKAAFDAASKLKVGGKPVTVIYAKVEKQKNKKKEKAAANENKNKVKENESKKKAGASKKRKIEEVDENESKDKKKLKEDEEQIKSEESSEPENDKEEEEIKSEESSEVENDKDEEAEVKEESASGDNEDEESDVENDAESDED